MVPKEPMVIGATDFREHLAEMFLAVQHQPIVVTKGSFTAGVLLSMDAWKSLKNAAKQ